jgi:hypothetical protein
MVGKLVGLGRNHDLHDAIESQSHNLYAFTMFSSTNVWMSIPFTAHREMRCILWSSWERAVTATLVGATTRWTR